MKVKAEKSRSLSIRRDILQVQDSFVAGGEPIPRLDEKPLRSLGRQYKADLSDRQMEKLTKHQLADGVAKTEQSQLSGKHKVRYYQHILYQRILWPVKVCEIASSEVSRMDSIANSYILKWDASQMQVSLAGACWSSPSNPSAYGISRKRLALYWN